MKLTKINLIIIIIVINVFFVFKVYAAESEQKLNDLTIIVSSCDRYSSLWEPFFRLLLKNWPSLESSNKDVPILLISNNKEYNSNRVTPVLNPKEKSWSDNLLRALSKVKTKYVLILLEDYILNSKVNEDKLSKIINFMAKDNVAYMQLFGHDKEKQEINVLNKELNAGKFKKHTQFRTSLQAGIWDKKVLLWLLKDDESAWDFEKSGSLRSEGVDRDFYALMSNDVLSYLNAVHLSVLDMGVIDYIRQQGVGFENKTKLKESTQLSAKWRLRGREFCSFLYKDIATPVLAFGKKFIYKYIF